MAVGGVQVHAVAVDLPDFHERVADRLTAGIENLPGKVRDLADRRRDAVVDDDEIVIGIERQAVGLDRAFGLRWSEREGFGECAADVPKGRQSQAGGGDCCIPDKLPTSGSTEYWVHGTISN
jgi:hypothetical protein